MKTMIGALATVLSASASAQTPAPAPPAAPADPLLGHAIGGSWTYSQIPGGSDAIFVDSGGRAQLTIRCTRASRQISIIRPASNTSASLQVWTSTVQRQLPATFDAAASQLRSEIAVSDRLLDALSFSRGKFAIAALGAAPLVVPNWPEPTRAIEDCRN